MDGDVLAELRAIRGEIQALRETTAKSASREDLNAYVRNETFDAYVAHQRGIIESWRGWWPGVVATVALLWNLIGPYVHLGVKP